MVYMQIEKLRAASGNLSGRAASPTSSCSGGADQDSRGVIDYCTGFFGLEKSKVVELVNAAMEELVKMATAGEPLWVRSVETGRDILNYDEYVRRFSPETAGEGPRRSVEASRESCVVFMDAPKLVQAFMDAVITCHIYIPRILPPVLYSIREIRFRQVSFLSVSFLINIIYSVQHA